MRSTFSTAEAAALLRGWSGMWGVAGGWAIDLTLGEATRPHEDLDIALLRGDADSIRAFLEGWDLQIAHDGQLTSWLWTEPLPQDRHAVWCRPSAGEEWAFELLFNDHEDDEWLFRRDHSIRRPLSTTFARTERAPILDPAIVLLYKAKSVRDRDQADFDNTVSALSRADRIWLAASIESVHRGHPWVDALG